MRISVDYRRRKRITEQNSSGVPRMDEGIDALEVYFSLSTIDFDSVYRQVGFATTAKKNHFPSLLEIVLCKQSILKKTSCMSFIRSVKIGSEICSGPVNVSLIVKRW